MLPKGTASDLLEKPQSSLSLGTEIIFSYISFTACKYQMHQSGSDSVSANKIHSFVYPRKGLLVLCQSLSPLEKNSIISEFGDRDYFYLQIIHCLHLSNTLKYKTRDKYASIHKLPVTVAQSWLVQLRG